MGRLRSGLGLLAVAVPSAAAADPPQAVAEPPQAVAVPPQAVAVPPQVVDCHWRPSVSLLQLKMCNSFF